MANQEHLEILKQGVEAWNNRTRENPLLQADFTGAHFPRANLRRANFHNAHLSRANFSNANLEGADLGETNLRRALLNGADLRGAILYNADLTDANLSRTNLRYAALVGANLTRAQLERTDLSNAGFGRTEFADVDLSTVIGLDTARYTAPSTIGTNTLSKSAGNISKFFLRGCGLSDWEIECAKLYDPSLSNEEINNIQYRIHDIRVRRAFQINPLFISYSHSDGAFVDAVERLLVEQGIRFWRDVHHAVAGRLERQIDQAIHINDIVLLVLSEQSTNSDWVEHEVRKAREKEKKTGKDALCPVRIDDSWRTCRWPKRLREQVEEYRILDFTNWQDDAHFERMAGRLLEGLNLFYK